MSDWFTDTCKALIPEVAIPDIFVETGTYHGGNIPSKIGRYSEIHTIDLSEKYVEAAREKHAHPSVTYHHGDSGDVLETLVDRWKAPVMFFLDAHWSGGDSARAADAETPLLREMKALSRRKEQADIIFIDDTRFMGKKSFGGTPGCKDWPYTEFDWRDITMEALLKAYGRECRVINCTDIQDRIILVPRLSTVIPSGRSGLQRSGSRPCQPFTWSQTSRLVTRRSLDSQLLPNSSKFL